METVRNGVNVNDLMMAIEAVKNDPANGKLTFTVKSKWKDRFKAEHKSSNYVIGKRSGTHEHIVSTDEPKEILGEDSGISPAETLLSSLGACLTIGYAANAAAMGIDIDGMSFEITAHGSLEGFMDIGDSRPGLTDISVKTHIKSDAPDAKLRELHDYVNQHSPIWDTIKNPAKMTSELTI